jgi:hypothetical protein
MRKTKIFHGLAAATLLSGLLAGQAMAQEALNLMFGDPAGEHATVTFSPDKTGAQAIVVGTHLVGVAGSRLSLSVDRAGNNIVDHILTAEECKFGDTGSDCSFAIAGDSPEYATLVTAFKRGLKLHIEVENAGSMEMSQDISLIGFTKAYGKL